MSNERRAERAGNSRMHMSDDKFFALSGQVQTSYQKMDDLLAHMLRMNADMIDTAQDIGLEPEKGQRLFKQIHACLSTMVQGRQDLVTAHLEATKIRMKTNQAERADGCYIPRFWEETQGPNVRLVG